MEIPLQQMCRTCLSSGVALVSLLTKSSSFTVAEMLSKFTDISVSPDDALPKRVCLNCVSEIKRSYFFKIKCESSQDTLQEYVSEVQAATEEILKTEPDNMKVELRPHPSILRVQDFTVIEMDAVDQQIPESLPDQQLAEMLNQSRSSDTLEDIDMQDEQQEESNVNETEQKREAINESDDEDEDVDCESLLESASDMDDERVVILACRECCDTFESRTEFEAHVADCGKANQKPQITPPRSSKKCPYCPMDFVHKKNLDKHIGKCHLVSIKDDKNARKKIVAESSAENDSSQAETEAADAGPDDDQSSPVSAIRPEDAVLRYEPATLPGGEFICTKCGAGFVQKKSLIFHLKVNKCTVKQFFCKLCEKVFINEQSLMEHVKIHEKAYKCVRCDKSFTTVEKLQNHYQTQHSGAVKNECKFCGKFFTMLSTLKDHLRIHSGEKPFLCSICGKGFSQNTNLKQHVMRHQNLKPYACNHCDCSFVSKGELNAHVRKHTGDHPFVCNVCGASFTTSSSLVKHKRIHTGERPYACDLCPMRFSALGTLKNHRRTHTGEKPFKCSYCPRSFTQRSDCISHMRNHTGERPYICSTCGYGLANSTALKNHMRLHEKNKEKENAGVATTEIITKIENVDGEDTESLNIEKVLGD